MAADPLLNLQSSVPGPFARHWSLVVGDEVGEVGDEVGDTDGSTVVAASQSLSWRPAPPD